MTACVYRLNLVESQINHLPFGFCDIDITFSMSEYARPNIHEVFNSMKETLQATDGKIFMSALNTWQFVFKNANSVSSFGLLHSVEQSLNQTTNDRYFFDQTAQLTHPELRAISDSAN